MYTDRVVQDMQDSADLALIEKDLTNFAESFDDMQYDAAQEAIRALGRIRVRMDSLKRQLDVLNNT